MSDSYPEYLNPFAEDVKPKTKLTIRNSFKELKRNLRQSFRIKKKDEEAVTIREKTDTVRRVPQSYPNPQMEALPRSRFRERLSRLERSDMYGQNPFEEEENGRQSKPTTMRRKNKKRAPLPPKSISSQNINEDPSQAPYGGSHWSLTSVETDYSSSTEYKRSEDNTEIRRESMAEKFVDFNKHMDQLKDDSNNNIVNEVEETDSNSHIPDLVISCPSETNVKSAENTDTEDEKVPNNLEDVEKETEVSKSTSNDLVEETTNNVTEEEENVSYPENTPPPPPPDDVDNRESYLYHEKTSLYIAGSRDELNDSNIDADTYRKSVSLFITGSCDDLDSSNNNNEASTDIAANTNNKDNAVPLPKQRKNKLSKNILLGM